ncbi:MAG: hypothetical protein V1778_01805 [bacterium]
MNNPKWEFINNEIITWSIQGSFSRGKPIYIRHFTEQIKNNFKYKARQVLRNFSLKYQNQVNSKKHTVNITELKELLSQGSGKILVNGVIGFGRTQKLLNLYLKYLWVLGQIPEPPHCPFDSIVIHELESNKVWTDPQFNEKDYWELVEKAGIKAKEKNLSIASWELGFWNKKNAQI